MNQKLLFALTHLATLALGVGLAWTFFGSSGGGGSDSADGSVTFNQDSGDDADPDAPTSPDGNLSAYNLNEYGFRAGMDDPIAAIAAAEDIPGMNNRMLYLQSVFTAWGEKNGAAAAEWANANLNGMEKTDALYNIADGWAEADPAAAAEWFDANTSGTNREDAFREVLESWGRKSPDEAAEWAQNLDANTQSWVMDSLAEGWAAKDPAAAAAAGQRMTDRDYGDEFLMTVAGQWADSDPQAAARWADSLTDPDLIAVTHMEIGVAWAAADAQAASEWVDSLPEGEERKYGALGAALGWSDHDPAGALSWTLEKVDDEDTRSQIVEDVMLDWSDSDPVAAAEWLNGLPKDERTDEVLENFSYSVFEVDPASAVTWANTINDPVLKNQHIDALLQEWVDMDGDAARQWIDGSSLDPELKKKFGSQ